MLMGVTPVSSPHVAAQPTTTPAPTRTPAAANNNEHGPKTARPTQSSTAPGTGLKVDKHA
jgi:hypothetical protein